MYIQPPRLYAHSSLSAKERTLVPLSPPGLTISDRTVHWEFRPSITSWDKLNAFWMMRFAAQAFMTDDPRMEEELTQLGFSFYETISHPRSGLKAFIISNQSTVILAFRGTSNIANWCTDFDMKLIDASTHSPTTNPGMAHRGFTRSLNSSWSLIREKIDHCYQPNKKIWVTGHSLGGALATLTALRLKELGYNLGPVYTFAAPAVGCAQLNARISDHLQLFRIVTDHDIVPRLPPERSTLNEIKSWLPVGRYLSSWLANQAYGKGDYCQSGTLISLGPHHFHPVDESTAKDDHLNFWTEYHKAINQTGIQEFWQGVRAQAQRHNERTYLSLIANHSHY